MTRPALILAGHGSHVSANTAGLVWRYVDQLRVWGVADEITACFWKEPPTFSRVLDTVEAQTVVVVPVFMAAGYFTQSVIPAEMGLTGPLTWRDGRTIHYTRTLSEHPYLSTIVAQRAADAAAAAGFAPENTTVAIIGHGTPRSARSQDAARQQSDQLRENSQFADVIAVYLDGTPAIPSLYTTAHTPNVIALPFFLAPGSHVSHDVPGALGLTPGESAGTIQGKNLVYTPPIGTDDTLICRLIIELACEADYPFDTISNVQKWHGFPRVGRDLLWETVTQQGELFLGQLHVTPTAVHPINAAPDAPLLTSPAAIRRVVRETPFRPLPTADDLPGGWRVQINSAAVLSAVIETIYPSVLASWAQHRRGTLNVTTLNDTLARQQGMFRSLDRLSPTRIEHFIRKVCGGCVLHPAWAEDVVIPDCTIPCPEPCNVWLSHAKSHQKGTNL